MVQFNYIIKVGDFLKALVTGASSGIGRDIAYELAKKGYDLFLVARRGDKLDEIKKNVSVNCTTISCDLAHLDSCTKLCQWLVNEDIDVVVNCAGLGVFGGFSETDLDREINMINVNITALHIITKFFVRKFTREKRGYILNVASSAAFAPGPTFSSYYASKAYVLRLTQAIAEEVRGQNIYVGTLCPGTVETEFSSVANTGDGVKGASSKYVAKYAVDKMFKKKNLIIPGFKFKIAVFFSRFLPDFLLAKITAFYQSKKKNG